MKLIPKEDTDCEHAHFIRVNKFVEDYNSNDSSSSESAEGRLSVASIYGIYIV